MRFEWSTPHQFQAIEPYVDTLVVKSHTPFVLDVAAPQGAASWLTNEVALRVQNRFVGRTACIDVGAAVAFGSVGSVLDYVPELVGYRSAYGVLIGDRMILDACVRQNHWIVFDWHRWVLSQVETRRVADAWMYMCVAHAPYRASVEFMRLGLPSEMVAAMQAEGERLLDAMASDLSRHVRELWNESNKS